MHPLRFFDGYFCIVTNIPNFLLNILLRFLDKKFYDFTYASIIFLAYFTAITPSSALIII
jgi:hypothetical protein